ncbi:MAG: poly-gamma-glutamate biosynthesis protein PgsC/CapC [Eubacteriales bacterium]|nr:poly-gamma-glutamate biosynthesis protein PgsC/CapC [Eubacteriales bacterium]
MYNEMIIVGILLSLAYSELSGLSPGGVIVPAYFAINFVYPERALYTFVCALVTSLIVKTVFAKFVIYGRRMFVLCIALSFCLNFILQLVAFPVPGYISYLVPGILAREFERQGFISTTISLIIVSGLTLLVLTLLGNPII